MSSEFRRALIVEDEVHLARALQSAVRALGSEVECVGSLAEARKAHAKERFDLLLLDRGLPDGDGLELCREWRAQGDASAILVLTASGDVEARVQGLDAGADDYLPKPFAWDELAARVRALARRKPNVTPAKLSNEPELWALDAARLSVQGPRGGCVLTPLEFKFVSKLLSQPGKIVTREELLRDVWGFRWLPQTRTVDYFMTRVRKKFEPNPEEPRYFLTVRGAGYRFEP